MKKVLAGLMIVGLFSFTSSYSMAETVKAKLTQGSWGSVNTEPARIEVPSGNVACNFSALNGSNNNDRGWTIVSENGRNVYTYTTSNEDPVSLSNLKLNSGVYYVYVSGTAGSNVTVNYDLK